MTKISKKKIIKLLSLLLLLSSNNLIFSMEKHKIQYIFLEPMGVNTTENQLNEGEKEKNIIKEFSILLNISQNFINHFELQNRIYNDFKQLNEILKNFDIFFLNYKDFHRLFYMKISNS